MPAPAPRPRNLVIVLGDQLDVDASCFDGFDAARDVVWMAEVHRESTHVWSAKQRITLFLSAMRHFAEDLRGRGRALRYVTLDDPENAGSLGAQLRADIRTLRPEGLVMTAPGDWRVLEELRDVAADTGVALDVREDRHFFCTVRDFASFARGKRGLRMETFYRMMRRTHGVLMDGDEPCGGRWNFDEENRSSFGAGGPREVPAPYRVTPDEITRAVMACVERTFPDHPGSTERFAWPVSRTEALVALDTFIRERLPQFGTWQDAMWTNEPWLWHAHISSSLNLKLITPREVVSAAEEAYRTGAVPLASAEGFIRQVLGWREYVRGIYWTRMPAYGEMNALDAHETLPAWYWTGDTDMACLRDVLRQTLDHGYAHHIQRLMVTGLYALLLGVHPRQIHEWFLAVYVDAVEWVELPNVIGMSQHADGGYMASKPYIASGKYIDRMGPHCTSCRFDPTKRVGNDACPFTTLYWDFLLRHEERFADHPRLALQVRNLARIDVDERAAIAERARTLRR
jgi:deoxyribodipyrimidine photolyase-related protein